MTAGGVSFLSFFKDQILLSTSDFIMQDFHMYCFSSLVLYMYITDHRVKERVQNLSLHLQAMFVGALGWEN